MPITRIHNNLVQPRTWLFDPDAPGALLPIISSNAPFNNAGGVPSAGLTQVAHPTLINAGNTNQGLYFGLSQASAVALGTSQGLLYGAMGDSWMAGGYAGSYYTYARPAAYIYRRPGQTLTATFVLRLPRVVSTTSADCPQIMYGLTSYIAGPNNFYGYGYMINGGAHTTGTTGSMRLSLGFTGASTSLSGSTSTGNAAGDAEYSCSVVIDSIGNISTSIAGLTTSGSLGTNLLTSAALFWICQYHGTASAPRNMAGIRALRIAVN
jgi:hypothetical protein